MRRSALNACSLAEALLKPYSREDAKDAKESNANLRVFASSREPFPRETRRYGVPDSLIQVASDAALASAARRPEM